MHPAYMICSVHAFDHGLWSFAATTLLKYAPKFSIDVVAAACWFVAFSCLQAEPLGQQTRKQKLICRI